MIHIECNPWVGLGTAINVLSLCADLKDNVRLVTNSDTSVYHQLLSIFNLPTVSVFNAGVVSSNIIGETDFCKVVSRYFKDDVIDFTPAPDPNDLGKKVIVLTQFNGQAEYDIDSEYTTFPYNRYYPLSIYKKLFSVASLAGYEIVTLNNNYMQLSELVTFLKRYCACVIGYEGGIAHLAHVLNIPTIVFPWHHQPDGSKLRNVNDVPNNAHLLHLDKKTYIPEDVEEIYSWDQDKLVSLIDQLNNNKGNNKFLNNYVVKKINNKLCLYPYDRRKSIVYAECNAIDFAIIDKYISHDLILGGI